MNEVRDSAEFWNNWVYPDGASAEQIQSELADYHFILEQVSKVYCAVTGGMLSKPNYEAEVVIRAFNDYLQRCVEEEIRDREEMKEAHD